MNLSNNTMLITGGASGIGLSLAERFIHLKNKVIICGRRVDKLNEVRARFPSIITFQCNLSEAGERIRLFEFINREHPDLNILVNNAGIQNWMQITDNDFYLKAMEEININIAAPVHLCSLFLKLKSLSCIINITSGLGYIPLTRVPVYSATKAFLHSFTQSLRPLTESRKIEVIEIIPPALNTDLGGIGIHDQAPPVSEFMEAVFHQLKEGKSDITYGFTEHTINSYPEAWIQTFKRMNQLN